MLRKLALGLLISSFLFPFCVAENEYGRCDCNHEEGFWSLELIMQGQRAGDFLIAVAYFSIPIELLYFVSCSNVPFKWVLVQFIAFIVLCGMTHLLNGWTYGPHPFQIMLALTVFKFLTALVSFATAITLVTLIPLLLKVKVREFMLKKKTWDLRREVRIIRKQKETGLHVRMLTQEIRKSLDRHTILYSTLVELSKTLDLQNCAVWMPNEGKTELHLTHELNPSGPGAVVPIGDVDVRGIKQNDGVKLLEPGSVLVSASGGGAGTGPGAGIRIPILKVSNFKGGTPELVPFCYAVLVLVLPGDDQGRSWSNQDIDILRGVADQVAVALSHASILEESQNMRDRLADQNRALQQAKQDAMLASQARVSFQKAMGDGMRKPMHSVIGLLSMLKDEKLGPRQDGLIRAMARTGNVVSTLVNDVMDISTRDDSGRLPLEVGPFGLRSMVRDAACVAKCLCIYRPGPTLGLGQYAFVADVDRSLPDEVVGDERRVFQVILHMIGNLLRENSGGGCVTLRACKEREQRWQAWRASSSDGYVTVKFEIGINNYSLEGVVPRVNYIRKYNNKAVEQGLSFSVCKKLVQLMQGNIWIVPNPKKFDQSMALVLRFQIWPPIVKGISEPSGESSERNPPSLSLFRGLEVLLADSDDTNRGVTKKLLTKLGCSVTTVRSGTECLASLGAGFSPFQVVILDLNLPDLDGADVAVRIRKFRSRNWPIIVALTASGDEEIVEKCFENGMNGVIRKPVVLQGIADELRRVFSQGNN